MISFHQFWRWFSFALSEYNKENPEKKWLALVKGRFLKEVAHFSAYRIISIEERALMRFITKADKEGANQAGH